MSKLPAALIAARLFPLLAGKGRKKAAGLLVVLAGEDRAELVARILADMAPDATVRFFPAWDCLPYDRASPSPDIMGRRMRVLSDLATSPDGAVVVTTPVAVLQRVPQREACEPPLILKRGAVLDGEALVADLERFGYHHADQVEEPGQFAIRGEVVDLFPPGPKPYRLTVMDGEARSIHRYDPISQRSSGAEVDHVRVDPVSELAGPAGTDPVERFPGMEHWLPAFLPALDPLSAYLPKARVLIDPQAEARAEAVLAQVAEAHAERAAADRRDGAERTSLPPDRLYLAASEWQNIVAAGSTPFPGHEATGTVPRFSLERSPKAFEAAVVAARDTGQRVVLAAGSSKVLQTLAKRVERATGAAPRRIEHWGEALAAEPGSVLQCRMVADHGFADGDVTFITASDVLGRRAEPSHAEAVHSSWHGADAQLSFGDAVVHFGHGLGALRALETLDGEALAGREAARFTFAKDADLLTPVEDLDQVWRYGTTEGGLPFDRLDSDAWDKRRARILGEVLDTARGLVELAALRDRTKAPKLVPPDAAYERFAAGFPFAPTADQGHAIAAALDDLASGRPMDRLVVGDVGFGKTEVAMRAAAAAVLGGRQVAVVAPTTVLVRQHVANFRKRFEPLGIAVAHLSRLVSAGEAKQVREGLADGSVRIVVGTHAVAAKGVAFKDLGLLVVDEEQRFGTADKERLRGLGTGIHVLTLTATPIPRTLQSALVGLQDLSVIATPPARRRPIRTLVAPFDRATVRTALLHEKARGGQSFVVVPRIEDLDRLAAELQEASPELDMKAAHGQMPAADVDETMVAFAEGRGDVLLATSIIESGLDVPRANTMIVADADRFGLAQLHQLRGRVGRGRQQGICYLMTDPDSPLPEATLGRLNTLATLDRLGSGMAISARDLDLRGAGDLMGDEQAGHVRLIGLGLYQHLLQLAIRQARGEAVEDWTPELHVDGFAGTVPADYIPEPEIRLNIYARLARIADAHEADAVAEEIEDRFGPLPPKMAELLAFARLRSLCRSRGVARIDAGPKAIALTIRPGTEVADVLDHVPAADRETIRTKNGRLIDPCETASVTERLQRAVVLLGEHQ